MPLVLKQKSFMKLFYLAWFINLAVSIEVIIIQDSDDKKDFLWDATTITSFLQNSAPQIDWHICQHISAYQCIDSYPNAYILLDLSQDLSTQLTISQLCQESKRVHLVIQDEFKYFDDRTYSVISSKNHRFNAFFAVLNYYSWSKGTVFTTWEDEERFLNFTSNFELMIIESWTDMENLIMRVVPPLGSTLYYIFTQNNESLSIQNYLESAHLLTEGSGIIFNQKSGYKCKTEGALIVTEEGQENVDSEEKYLENSIMKFLNAIINTQNYLEAITILSSNWKSHYGQDAFSLVNVQAGKRITIGSVINGQVIIRNSTIFPGETTSIPKSNKKILNLSIEAGITNPNYSPSTIGSVAARGAYLAIDYINAGTSGMLPNYQIDMFNYDCGVTIYNATYAKACFKKDFDSFGLAHIVSYASSMALGVLKLFKSLNWTIPIIGINSDPSFNSSTLYPFYQRVWPSTSFTLPLIPVLLRSLGWEKAAVLYQNDSWGQGGYYYLKVGANTHDMLFVNPDETRAIPTGLDRATIKNHLDIIQGVINSDARLVIFIIQVPLVQYVIETFYDLGLRRGDILIFTAVPDILTNILTSDDYLYKRLEIGVPMMTFFGEQWVGEFGQGAYTKIVKQYNATPSSFACHYFDIIYLIGHALDFMINRGQDYTNPYKLESVIRNTQFTGCSGRVIIEKGTNDRITSVLNVQADKFDISGNVIPYFIGVLKPFSTQILHITNPLVYPGGTTTKPTDLRNQNSDCPFPDDKVKTFIKGKILIFGICFAIALVSMIITFVIWKRWWNIPIEELKEKQEISFPDLIVAITIAIEFFQYASMGPNISYLSSVMNNFSNSLTLELTNIIKLKNGVFWIIVDAVYGLILLWISMCAVVLFRLDEKYSHFSIFRFVAWLADYMMPILGNLCFIPFISICLDIFVCDQSIGDNFTDSFLSFDCYYFCWKDEHLVYAILSFFALLCYEPLAVFCRPLWQELQLLLHVKAVPLFLMVKTIIQVALIVMNKTVKRAQDITHGVLFIAVMIIYIVFLYKFKPYNYSRFNLWQNLSLIGVVWLAILSTVALGTKGNSVILTIFLFVGWLIIGLIGLYIQRKRCPSLLFRKKGHDTASLFKFAFTFGKSSRKALNRIAPSSGSLESQNKNKKLNSR
ncbi:unnamed protein product [Blepharisma stoltei]|uniref:Receptor ligand binding region domain-containing protein n=1 Tax=Blepharisma stoltei TaxID=1481888 RepID=A0AAU9J6F5_9CILI|nr:unnamed protein product [Blepharisma stoltei]